MYSAKVLLAVFTVLTTLTAIALAQTYQIYDAIRPNFGCWIQIQENFCSCSDIFALDGQTCESIDSQVSAGINGGNIGPLKTCKGFIDVNFFGGGNLSVTYSQDDGLCSDGCDIYGINTGSGRCSV